MERTDAMVDMLEAQCVRYPALRLQDLFKALYQSVFGCGHLIKDPSAAASSIREEAESSRPAESLCVEPLGPAYCRVHLNGLAESGLRAETLARLFQLSARTTISGSQELEAGLGTLLHMAERGELPFRHEEVSAEIKKWREKGFPACRHTEQFRAAYAPSYRVLRRDHAWALPLFAAIDRKLEAHGQLLVAIDGGAAAGKSTLADLLSQVYDCNVFHMDDFFMQPEQRTVGRYLEPGGNVDRERFGEEVLVPLSKGRYVEYRRFDCRTCTIQPPVLVKPKAINIVEGTYSMHPALEEYYDLTVFLQISPEEQKKRIFQRNSPDCQKQFFDFWIPLERTYFHMTKTRERCHVTLEARG